jgi:hypothetical protein
MGAWEFLSDSYTLTIISIILAIISIGIAFYFYFRSQKMKLPAYALRSVNLIQNLVGKFEKIEMYYSGDRIENLTASKVAFWNEGKDTINYSDVAPANPIEIFVQEGLKILDAKIIFEKNPVNQFKVEISTDRSFTKLIFDYIDQDEGIIVQLLHTGNTKSDIGIRGSIKGVKEIS